MDLIFFLTIAAVLFSLGLAVIAPFRSQQKVASWFFAVGMVIFALESGLQAISLAATSIERANYWQNLLFVVKSLVPGVWFCFSVIYARGEYRAFFRRWRIPLILGSLLPVLFAITFRARLGYVLPYSETDPTPWLRLALPGKILNAMLLLGSVLILMNLERTLRSAVGTGRWRIKFLVLGLGVIFGVRIYARSQALLYSGHMLSLGNLETGTLLLGCLLIGAAYVRRGFGEVDVYPSRAVLHTSLTVLLTGSYLLIVGLLAQIVARLGGTSNFALSAFLLLIGIVVLAILLLSEKVRQRTQAFVSRNFKRPQHDVRRVWTRFTEGMAGPQDASSLCAAVARLLSETFSALSVSVWLADSQSERLVFVASTAGAPRPNEADPTDLVSAGPGFEGLQASVRPFDLDASKEGWAKSLRQIGAGEFTQGGNRICLPLRTAGRCLGVAILADRVNGLRYTIEELDLLECIGGQVGASLLNLRLAAQMAAGKEIEAFQAVAAFFVHDLKNAASTLNLMLTNLPVHFDDPGFRADALRGIASTVDRINQLIERAGALQHGLELKPSEVNLNVLLSNAIDQLGGGGGMQWVKNLQPVPKLLADHEQLQSVVTNLLLNAADAVNNNGVVRVETGHENGWAQFVVADNGCGMTRDFLQKSLFRPFRTTKKKGLGIGMFQSKMIIDAHHGKISVESELGIGTTFRVSLPLKPWPT